MLEKEIEKYLKQEVKKKKGLCYKFISPGHKGVPDRIVIMPKGAIYFIELKTEGKKPTDIQLLQHKKLSSLGCTVLVIDSKKGVDDFINGF